MTLNTQALLAAIRPDSPCVVSALELRELVRAYDRYTFLRNRSAMCNRLKVEQFSFPRATWELISDHELDAAIDAGIATIWTNASTSAPSAAPTML